MARTLRELLSGLDYELVGGRVDCEISAVVSDSREAVPGSLFVCLPGYCTEGGEQRADRHEFIGDALERGAHALVLERVVPVPPGVTVVRVPDAWSAAAHLASRFHGEPSKHLKVVGVTGTSGKTSTVYFIDSVLRAAGWTTARLGTVEHRVGSRVYPAQQTTPEAPHLQSLLRQAVDAGCGAVVMEVSSHALELRRVASIAFDVGVFTNLGRDHLNFHPDFHHYRRAKGRLFEELGSGGKDAVAVVNRDDANSDYMLQLCRGRKLTFSLRGHGDVTATNVYADVHRSGFVLRTPKGACPIELAVPGAFQVQNALAAAAVGVALDLPLDVIAQGLATAPAVPGRFEVVNPGGEFLVVVDYAHKPDALERLLGAARALGPRRLLVVFGCGGDRDRGKRPLMGEVAARLGDVVFVTSDNPRSEDPPAIIDDILTGIAPNRREHVHAIVDRREAIEAAIDAAEPGDLVIIAGKGHETYQLFADRRVPFDDRDVARAALARRAAVAGLR